MRAVWECRLANQAPIGSYLDPTFSFDTRPMISREPLSAFEKQIIHKLTSLQHSTSCNPHQRQKCLKHSRLRRCDDNLGVATSPEESRSDTARGVAML